MCCGTGQRRRAGGAGGTRRAGGSGGRGHHDHRSIVHHLEPGPALHRDRRRHCARGAAGVRQRRHPDRVLGQLSCVSWHVTGIGAPRSIIWFDAHGDVNTPETTETGYFDGMALATALGWGWTRLVETDSRLFGRRGIRYVCSSAAGTSTRGARAAAGDRVSRPSSRASCRSPIASRPVFEHALAGRAGRIAPTCISISM